ncbi:MAG: transcriptional regulator [Desulfobulbus propionicus]|nr:MAG: transcriptional regulator [Desulfobulbus propionicus]
MTTHEICHPVNASEIRDQLPLDNQMQELAQFFKVFAEASRIRILMVLYIREQCVCDLVDILDMNQPAVSHQLRVLRAANVVKSRKEGKHVYYSLDDDHVRELLYDGLEHIQGHCP